MDMIMNKMRAAGLIGALAAASLGVAAQAAEPLPPQLEPCVSLRRDAERLACYDKAIANMLSGDEKAAPASAENMFGANSGNAPVAPAADVKREELRQISGKVTSLRRTDDGMIVLELDNGQVWRQQDSGIHLMVSAGDTVTIQRASLGTFRLADKTGRFARFKRVR